MISFSTVLWMLTQRNISVIS